MRGLGEWAAPQNSARVFQSTSLGCKLATGGVTHPKYGDVKEGCGRGPKGWAFAVEQLDPDVVVLLTGGSDLMNQKPPGQTEFLGPGASAFDDWLAADYGEMIDVLTARGATVAWLTFPCVASLEEIAGSPAADRFEARRIRWLNESLIPRVAGSRATSVEILDLFSHVCPNGEFTNTLGTFDVVRWDGVHFGEDGRRYVAEWLGPRLLALARHRSEARPNE
jgi:lysophospholipase L1-like esterase